MEEYLQPASKKIKSPFESKKEESETKRLAALEEKLKQEKKEKDLIKSALRGQLISRKIVFADSPVSNTKKFESPASKSLFDDNDDAEQVADDINFNVSSKRLKSTKEAKIVELQSRFAHDPRFKIDDRFIDDEIEQKEKKDGISPEEAEERENEGKALDILEEVLGKPLKRKVNQLEEKQSSLILPRYDPTKPESQKFRIRKVEKLEPHQIAPPNEQKQETRPEVSQKVFYEISESFTKEITEQNDGEAFSLTKLFGRTDDQSSDESENEDGDESSKNTDKFHGKPYNNKGNDFSNAKSSQTIALTDPERKKNLNSIGESAPNKAKGFDQAHSVKSHGKVFNPLLQYEHFLFTDDDKRLQEDCFFKTALIKKHFKTWKEKRVSMSTALTKRRRHFKHVQKLMSTLETKNSDDKVQKKKYRILKKTMKKH